MGFLSGLGVPGVEGGVDLSGLGTTALIVFLIFVILVFVGGISFFYFSKKAKKTQFKNQIPIFTTLHGKHTRQDLDWAKELFIPDSNISLFYLKKRKIYIARPTRAMGKNEFWYTISENGEWINFDMSSDPDASTLAQANYDHRDTRYAYVNLKDIIKKNYKDKSVQWWKEYSPLITFIICAFIFIGGCWILISQVGKLIVEIGPFIDKLGLIADSMAQSVQTAQNLNSGVVPG